MTVDSSDRILFAVSVSDRETAILQSVDQGASFQEVQRLSPPCPGAPNLYPAAGGGFLLLVSQGSSRTEAAAGTGSVALAVSTSRNGRSWRHFAPFVTPPTSVGQSPAPGLACHAAGARLRRVPVPKVLSESTTPGSCSEDAARTAEPPGTPRCRSPRIGPALRGDPLGFNNERPRLAALEGRLGLVWERSPFGSDKPTDLVRVRLDAKGALVGPPENPRSGPPGTVRPRIISLRDQEYVLYADGSKGAFRIVLAQKGRTWETQPLPNTDVVNALFPMPLVFYNAPYHLLGEPGRSAEGPDSLVQLRPLTSVGAPVLKAGGLRARAARPTGTA